MSTVQGGTNPAMIAPEFVNTGDRNSSNKSVAAGAEKQAVTDIPAESIYTRQKATKADENNQPLTATQLDKVAQQLQEFVGDLNRNIEFSVDKDSGRDVIKVIDKDSGDLLKQYPSEEVLTLVSKLSDMVGGFIDAKV